jgi:sugar phosphate isomerase/epimerase
MKIPLSCSDFTFPLLPHHAACQLIHLIGLQGVDLGVFPQRSHLQPDELRGREKAAAKELTNKLENLNLKVSDVFVQTGADHRERAANSPEASEREAGYEMFLSALEFAVACGSRHITGLPGMPFEGVSESDSLKLAAEESSRRAAAAKEAGLVYGVEAHLGSIAPSPAKALELIHAGEGLSLTLDYGHFIYAGHKNEEIHPLLDHASHFHARGAALRQLQAPMKENKIDFSYVLQSLARRNYSGWICLEYVWIDWEGCNRADNVSETALLRDTLLGVNTA